MFEFFARRGIVGIKPFCLVEFLGSPPLGAEVKKILTPIVPSKRRRQVNVNIGAPSPFIATLVHFSSLRGYRQMRRRLPSGLAAPDDSK